MQIYVRTIMYRLGKIARFDMEVGRGSVLSPATAAVGAPAEAVKVEATRLSTGTVWKPHLSFQPSVC